jgi:hypothetical protein
VARNFSLLHSAHTDYWANATSCTMGGGVLSPGTKRPVRESDHSPPVTAQKLYLHSPISLQACRKIHEKGRKISPQTPEWPIVMWARSAGMYVAAPAALLPADGHLSRYR